MKKIIALYLCVAMTLFFCSCGSCQSDRSTSTLDILCELLAYSGEDTDGNGIIYSSDSEEGETGFFTRDTAISMYGEKRVNECFKLIEEFAVFTATRELGEVAVFRCYSSSDTDLISAMFMERADDIKVSLRNGKYEEKSSNIRVQIKGHYVLFSFVNNNDKLVERFNKTV